MQDEEELVSRSSAGHWKSNSDEIDFFSSKNADHQSLLTMSNQYFLKTNRTS